MSFWDDVDAEAEKQQDEERERVRRLGVGVERFKRLPERIPEIVAEEFATPGQIVAKLPTVAGAAIGGALGAGPTFGFGAPAGATAGAALGSAASALVEDAASYLAREGITEAPYEFLTGKEFLSKEEIAKLPPEKARLAAQRQMPLYEAAGRELADVATGVVTAPFLLGRAMLDEGVSGAADVFGEMGAGAIESVISTAARGGLRKEEPISSLLDISGAVGVPGMLKGAAAGKGVGGRLRSAIEGGQKGRRAVAQAIPEMYTRAADVVGDVPVVGRPTQATMRAAGNAAEMITSGYKDVTKELRNVIESAAGLRRGGIARATEPAQRFERALETAPPETAQAVMQWFADVEATQPARMEGLAASRSVRQLRDIAEDLPEILNEPIFKPVRDALERGKTWDELEVDIDALSIMQDIFSERQRPELQKLQRLVKRQTKERAKLKGLEEELAAAQARQADIRTQEQQARIESIDEQIGQLVPEDIASAMDELGPTKATEQFGQEVGSERWVDFAPEPKEAAFTEKASQIRERKLQPERVVTGGERIRKAYDTETRKEQRAIRRRAEEANPIKTQAQRDELFTQGVRVLDDEGYVVGDIGATDLGKFAANAESLRQLRASHRAELKAYKDRGEAVPPSVRRRHKAEIKDLELSPESQRTAKDALKPLNDLRTKGRETTDPVQAWRNATANLSDVPEVAMQQLADIEAAVKKIPGMEDFAIPYSDLGFTEWKSAHRALDEFAETRGMTKVEAQQQYIRAIEQEIADVEAQLRGNPLQMPKDVPGGDPVAAATKLRVLGAAEKGAAQANVKALNAQLKDLRREKAQAKRDLAKGKAPASGRQIQQAKIIGRREKEVASARKNLRYLERQRERRVERLRQTRPDFYGPDGLPSIADAMDRGIYRAAELEFLQRGGVMLTLDGVPLNTVEAAITRVGFGDDLVDAMKTGRLKFEMAPGGNEALARFMNEGGALQYLAAQAENAKALASYGRLSDDTLRANLTGYISAIYDEDVLLQQKRIIAEDQLQRDASRILSNVEDIDAASRELTRLIDKARAKISVGRGAMAGKPATLGPVDRGIFRRAIAKHNQDLDQQIIMGRYGPEKLPQIFAETLRKQEMALGEARVLRGAKEFSLDAAEIIGIDTMPKRQVKFGSKLDGTQESIPSITYQGETWAQIPTTKLQGTNQARWGELAGRWMRLQDIKKLEGSIRMRASLLRRVTNAWKANKILGRFGGHVMQLIENMTKTAFMGGVFDVRRLPGVYTSLRKAVRNPDAPESKLYIKARDAGVFDDDLLASGFPQLRMGTKTGPDFLEMMLDELRRMGGNAKVLDPSIRGKVENLKTAMQGLNKPEAKYLLQENMWEILTSLYELPTEYVVNRNYKGMGLKKLWEAQDATFRFYAFETALKNEAKSMAARSGEKWTAIYNRLLDDDAAVKRAAAESRRWGYDYSDLPRWAEMARSVPFVGIPFVAWPVKATGFYTRLGWERPGQFKLLKEATDAQTALADDRERRTLQFAPPWAKRRAVLVSPDQILNTTFMSPVTYWPLTENWVQGGTDQTNRGLFAGLGGALNSIYEVGVNYSTFLQRPIYKEDDTGVEKLGKALQYLTAQEGPGVVGDLLFKVYPAVSGESEYFRGRNLGPWEALAHMFGIKIETVEVGRAYKAAQDTYKKRIRDTKKWFKKLTPEERLDVDNRRKFDERMLRAADEFKGKLQPYY